jgi:hypothetical protein
MAEAEAKTIEALIVALPESAGSAIYGLVDIFASTGTYGASSSGISRAVG